MKKIALVTGGTKGIGKGITLSLLNKGYTVIATYASDSRTANAFALSLEKVVQNRLELFQCDLSKSNELYALIDYVKTNFQHLDCLVCNAGCTVRKPFTEVSDQDWQDVMQVTVNANFIMIREFYPIIKRGSRIIFIGSMMGVLPHATSIAYGVSKAALHALARNLVKEFEQTDTTINVIVPGFVETQWQKNKPQEIRDNINMKTAVGRFAELEEIVSAFDFCLVNGYVNGSLIEVSGGYNYK